MSLPRLPTGQTTCIPRLFKASGRLPSSAFLARELSALPSKLCLTFFKVRVGAERSFSMANWFPLKGCCYNCPHYESENAYQDQNGTLSMICCPYCPHYNNCEAGINPAKSAVKESEVNDEVRSRRGEGSLQNCFAFWGFALFIATVFICRAMGCSFQF